MQSSKIARTDEKAFLSDQGKEQRKIKEWERLEVSSRKLEIPREHFMQREARSPQFIVAWPSDRASFTIWNLARSRHIAY